MVWYNLGISEFLKTRVCKFLINRYLGQFLEENLTADQLFLDFSNGQGRVHDVYICCAAINSIFEQQGWDFEVTGGHVGSLTLKVPWNCLMSEDSLVEVSDLYLCLRPQPRAKNGTTMLESMWSSMSNSMQLAQECLENEQEVTAAPSTMEGLDKFAQTIDNILNRIKAKFINTTIRLEYLPTDSDTGIAIIIKIKSFEYKNESRNDEQYKENAEKSDNKSYLLSTHATHHISLEDITFYTEEFRIGDSKSERTEKHTSSTVKEELNETFNSSSSTDPYLSATSDNEMFLSDIVDDTEDDKKPEEADDVSETERCHRNGMVMMGRLLNKQEIRINMKLAENVEGPKVELQMSLGPLVLFISPRQMHMLILFCDVLLNGQNANDIQEYSALQQHQEEQLLKLSEEKLKQRKENTGVGLMANQTWSAGNARDNYDDNASTSGRDMYNKNTFEPATSESLFSSHSSMSSSMGSSASQGTSKRKYAIEKDQNAEISHFSIRMAGLYMVLLHDDILMQSSKVITCEPPLNKQSVLKLSEKSENFFRLITAYIATCNTSDLTKIGKIIQSNCDINHLRIMLAPIIVDGEERRTVKGNRTKLTVSIPRAEIYEVLSSVSIPILEFLRNEATHIIPDHPEICINMEKTFYVMKSTSGKMFTAPRLNIGINLGVTRFEFDISIFDRLNTHFTSPFSSYYPNATPVEQFFVNELSPSSQKVVESKSEIKINSDCLSLLLRFPIVDLRPIHDPDRAPWWQRNVRPDYLELKLQQFRMNYLSPSIYDVLADEINIFYHESFKAPSIHIGKASIYENTSNKYYPAPPEYPRIVIEIPTKLQLRELNEGFINKQNNPKSGEDTDSDPTAEESIKFNRNRDRESSPFCAKKVCRESDTPHSNDNEEETETLLIPGDTEEMNKFCEDALKFSKLQIKVYLPVISVQLKSKHLYELIYNRIITDFLMWESSVPKMNTPPQPLYRPSSDPSQLLSNAGMMDSIYAPFTMCKSNINFESSSSATNSGSESDNDAFYYSMNEKSRSRQRSIHSIYQTDYSNTTAFQLYIEQGMVSMLAPVRDAQNHVVPGQQGEFVLKVNSTNIFSVSGYHGNTNLGYFCVQGKNLEMYHCGQLPVPMYNSPLRDIDCSLPEWLKSTIYLTPKSLSLNDIRVNPKREMLSLAVQIKVNPDQGVKRIRLSLGVQNTTLKHNSSLAEHSWLTQIMDMFDIKDYPVPGFFPLTVLTELHVHLWDVSVDYRPIHFPFRAIITVGSLMVSSNLASGSSGLSLRFVAEESTLSLAPQAINTDKEKQEENKITVLPSTELICIADLGLFEISLLLQEKVTITSPKFDLRSSIKDLHLRTCSDSGKAFLEFIGYLAAKGDLEVQETEDFDDQSQTSSILQMQDEQLLIMNESTKSVQEVTQTQQEHVNNLMAEAMEESIFIPSTMCHDSSGDSEEAIDLGSDVFFFPDEQTKKGLDALVSARKMPTRKISTDSEDDFCFVAGEEKPQGYNNPDIPISTEDPLRIIDNHFCAPVGKIDMLKPPQAFPMAVERYTLCDLTMIWHMYGGHDFPNEEDKKKENEEREEVERRNVNTNYPMSEVYKMGVSYSKGSPSLQMGSSNLPRLTWRSRGGFGRKHDVLMEIHLYKARFSHESYPPTTEQASRQVLLITELEIRDRLAISNINKFLYHPTTGFKLRNGDNHMVAIKALHLRPEPTRLQEQECCLRISLLPIRLNIDQDSLLFLITFFNELGGGGDLNDPKSETTATGGQLMKPHQPPVMMVELPEAAQELQARKMVSENLTLLLNEEEPSTSVKEEDTSSETTSDSPIFFRQILFSPAVPIRLDYQGKRVELSHGPVAGLLMGLGQLQCSEICLKRISYRNGILGTDKLATYLIHEWLQDIKKRQLPKILGGVGPMYSLLQLVQGIVDLFWLPIEQYQKDGRLIRGLQRGAQSFTARTALAALEIASRIIYLMQITAETAYDMVSPGPSVKLHFTKKGKRKRINPPQDIREGMANAYHIVRDGFGDTAHTILQMAAIEHDQKGYTGAVGAMIRQIPPTIVRPLVLATQATNSVLGGVKNQLIPEHRIEAKEKWKEEEGE
ncbi:unnamed protein product [Diamesa serratosioi]